MYNDFMEGEINSVDDIEKLISDSPALLLYISTEGCNVCRELKPKIIKLLDRDFPKIKFQYIDLDQVKEASGQFSVFAVPTILVYFDGKEFFREGRNLGMEQLREKIERPYSMLFQ
ncbi:MAG: thioredoxin family protein [Acidobacteriota bacterium]